MKTDRKLKVKVTERVVSSITGKIYKTEIRSQLLKLEQFTKIRLN